MFAALSHSQVPLPLRITSSSLMLCGTASRKWSGPEYQTWKVCEPASSDAADSEPAEPSAPVSGRAGSPSDAVSVIVPDSGGAGSAVTAARSWPAERAGSRGVAAALGGAAEASSPPPAASTTAAGTAQRDQRVQKGRCGS